MNNQYNYDDNQYTNQYTPENNEVVPAKKTMGILSLVMGILSLVCSCCGGGLIWGILGIVFSSISVKNNEDAAGLVKGGKITSIIGIVVSVLAAIVLVILSVIGAFAEM